MQTGYKQRVLTAIDKFNARKARQMKISEAFPSNFLKHTDLNGKKLKLTVSHVEMEKLGDDTKPVLYFAGKQKGLVLNKTKASILAASFGDDTDDWQGQEVAIFPTQVTFGGEVKPAIGIEPVLQMAEDDEAAF